MTVSIGAAAVIAIVLLVLAYGSDILGLLVARRDRQDHRAGWDDDQPRKGS